MHDAGRMTGQFGRGESGHEFVAYGLYDLAAAGDDGAFDTI
jgi:hypothetical protein